MGGILAAYLLSMGIITVRWVKGPKQPPPPMSFLGASVIFGASGLIAEYDKKLGTTLAWAFLTGVMFSPQISKNSTLKPIGKLLGSDITNPTAINPNDAPQGTYPNGQTGPTNGGPDMPNGTLLGPGGQTPVPPNSPFTNA